MSVPGELRVVDDVATAFRDLVVEEAPRSIALSGGSTAERAYAALAAARELDWSAVDVYFGDERFVAVSDADSNEGMCRRVLLDHVAPRSISSMATAGSTPDAAADAYDALLRERPPIALVHLGLGPDGHTASLFPGSAALAVDDRLVVATGDDRHPHPRITLTYRCLAASPLLVVTVAGAAKRDALRGVRNGDRALPATRLSAERIVWLADHDAAG